MTSQEVILLGLLLLLPAYEYAKRAVSCRLKQGIMYVPGTGYIVTSVLNAAVVGAAIGIHNLPVYDTWTHICWAVLVFGSGFLLWFSAIENVIEKDLYNTSLHRSYDEIKKWDCLKEYIESRPWRIPYEMWSIARIWIHGVAFLAVLWWVFRPTLRAAGLPF